MDSSDDYITGIAYTIDDNPLLKKEDVISSIEKKEFIGLPVKVYDESKDTYNTDAFVTETKLIGNDLVFAAKIVKKNPNEYKNKK